MIVLWVFAVIGLLNVVFHSYKIIRVSFPIILNAVRLKRELDTIEKETRERLRSL